ncbi:SDR family NAD(P)-dependent oxidoreductase [Oceanibium sediminis]|uniref:SDR family NAD(P)-dependent oxidoreductase n=1 Tax=Oceanibium sediminis TaxID=2026339 RepID=UPI000DD41869|nr:SDR family oxidoreductase [Oceanibium sediminis]
MTNPIHADDIKGRVAVITGSGQGIGRHFAEVLAAEGAAVVIAERNAAKAEETARALRNEGARAIAVATDIAEQASVEAMRDAVLAEFGRIDILVNNAARMADLERRPFWEVPVDEFDNVLDINIGGTFRVSRAVVPGMIDQGWGRIVNLSSSTILMGHPLYLHYVASKSAIDGMTRAMARELSDTGVTVNALLPGQIVTGDGNIGQTDDAVARVRARQFVKRSGQVGDVSGLLVWLASSASDFVTGQSLVVDGGFALG